MSATAHAHAVDSDASSLLAGLLPEFDHSSRRSIFVGASPETVFQALQGVRFQDLTVFGALLAVRSLGRSRPPASELPVLAEMREADVVLVDERPPHEFAAALMGPFWTQSPFLPIPDRAAFAARPATDIARTAFGFRLEPEAGGTRLIAETRVQAPTEPTARRTLGVYWRLIGVVGATIWSDQMLAATRRRAEHAAGRVPAGMAWRAPLVSMGPALVANLLMGASVAATMAMPLSGGLRRRMPPRLRPLIVAGALAPIAYAIARPRLLTLGTTDDERRRTYPGDDLAADPSAETTRGVTIDAPLAKVWPWIVQMGQNKGGLYSFDWLENLAGLDFQSVDRIVPEWQRIQVGDWIRLAAGQDTMQVAVVEPERSLVWCTPHSPGLRAATASQVPFKARIIWGFHLAPAGLDRSRLVSRLRLSTRPRWAGTLLYLLGVEVPHFVMEQKMLRGIKQRAEATR